MDRVGKLQGKSTRMGVWKCYGCRKPFSVKVGTIFEDSHVGLHLWLQAIALVAASKKGISANQLHRTLGVTLKTAWFMGHRIREAMRSTSSALLGGAGTSGIVEGDETYFGRSEGHGKGMRLARKRKVFALLARRRGSFVPRPARHHADSEERHAQTDREVCAGHDRLCAGLLQASRGWIQIA
jgi:transposase-like protein